MFGTQKKTLPAQFAKHVGWIGAVCFLGAMGWGAPAAAEDWMFRRSYYSHAPLPGEEILGPPLPSRSAYRRAYAGTGPGFAARGGWRYNTTFLRSGNSVDVSIQREGWFELTP